MTSEAVSVAAAERPVEPEPNPGSRGGWSRRGREGSTGLPVARIAVAMVGVHLLVRGWIALAGYFGQDDLILMGRVASEPLSADLLLGGHDGHFLPAGHLLTHAATLVAPLERWPIVAATLLLQLIASLAVWRLLRLLLGSRPVVLLPFLLYLFSPLTLPAFTSWTTAVTALPVQAGLAWVCGDAIRLQRTGRLRYAVSGVLVFTATLAFSEKALLIPLVALAVTRVLARRSGASAPLAEALRRNRWLWAGLLALGALWVWRYGPVVGSPVVDAERAGSVATATDAVVIGIGQGILPALFGGPLFWSEGAWAAPPTAAVAAAAVAAVVVVGWTSWRRRDSGGIWWMTAAYITASVVVLVLRKLSVAAPAELTLGLRDFADIPVVVAIAVALVAAPTRDDRRRDLLNGTERRDVAVLAAVVFLGVSLWSSATYVQAWAAGPTREYVTNATASLRTLDTPLLEGTVPPDVVWAPAYPYNLVSKVFAPIGVEVATSTPELKVLDRTGRLVDGRVTNERALFVGPVPGCGHVVAGTARTGVALNGPVITFDWRVQLNYLASRDGAIEVSFDQGETVRVPVREGAHSVFVDLNGGGESLHVTSRTVGLSVCIDTGLVGLAEPAR